MIQGSVNKVDGSNAASGLYTFNSKGSSFVHNIVSFLYSGVGAAAIPARLRLRKNFGERAFSPSAVLVSISFYIYMCSRVIWFLPEDENDSSDSFVQAIVVIVFLILPLNSFSFFLIKTFKLAYNHFKEIYSHSEDKNYKYTYYRGEPISNNYSHKIGTKIFGYEVDEKIIRIYFEPKGFVVEHLKKAGISLVGIVVVGVSAYSIYNEGNYWLAVPAGLFCLWLITYIFANLSLAFSGFCLLLEEISIVMKIRDTVLDMVDGEYDMQFLLNQKQSFNDKEGTIDPDKSLDIAESIFQNPENTNLASFPVFEQRINQEDGAKVFQAVPSEIEDNYIENHTPEIKQTDENIVEQPALEIKERVQESGKKKKGSAGDAAIFFGAILAFFFFYYSTGFFPFTNYYLNATALVSPPDTKIVLTKVAAGLNSTTLSIEIENRGADTLYFPYTKYGDTRSIKILAKTYTSKYLGNIFSDTKPNVAYLKPEQSFESIITVPPQEKRKYDLVFDRFPIGTYRDFIIISEDNLLNQVFLQFEQIIL